MSAFHASLVESGFGEADLEAEQLGDVAARCTYSSEQAGAWQPGESDIHALTVPPGEYPNAKQPGSIEAAILEALEQVPRAPSSPELSVNAPSPRKRAR
jgi:hypothetical protein